MQGYEMIGSRLSAKDSLMVESLAVRPNVGFPQP